MATVASITENLLYRNMYKRKIGAFRAQEKDYLLNNWRAEIFPSQFFTAEIRKRRASTYHDTVRCVYSTGVTANLFRSANLFRRNLFASGFVPDFQKISEFVSGWDNGRWFFETGATSVKVHVPFLIIGSFSGGPQEWHSHFIRLCPGAEWHAHNYAFGVGVDQTAFNMHDGDRWQCPGDCPQKASTNHWYYS